MIPFPLRKLVPLCCLSFFLLFNNVYAQGKGQLRLTADRVGAFVFIDGQKKAMIGDSATSILLPEGSYQVIVEKEEGDWAYTNRQSVFIGADTTVSFNLALKPHFIGKTELIVSTDVDGLDLFLGEQEIGKVSYGKLSYFLPRGTRGPMTLHARGQRGDWKYYGRQSFEARSLESIHVKIKVNKKYTGKGIPNELSDDLFVNIKGGCFEMGDFSGQGEADETGPHTVCVQDFKLGIYEVTQGQWKQVMGKNPSKYPLSERHPVESVSWDEVQVFLKTLEKATGAQFRLPTEAEWEYACRLGGKNVNYCESSELLNHDQANFEGTQGFDEWEQTSPVGMFPKNSLGLHDMSGNVWEWVSDWYSSDYYSLSPTNDPQGPEDGTTKVERGGSWGNPSQGLRSTNRFHLAPDKHSSLLGFRLVQVLP